MKTIRFAYPSTRVGRSLALSLTDGEFAHGPHLPGLSAIHFPRSLVTKRAAGPTDYTPQLTRSQRIAL